MKKLIYKKKTKIEAPAKEVFEWHEKPHAFERLSPPWNPVKVISRSNGIIKKGARVKMKMFAGPVPYLWEAEHTEYVKNEMFQDKMKKGILSEWTHTHQVLPENDNTSYLEDSIEFSLPFGQFLNPLFGNSVKKNLDAIFTYRHNTLSSDLWFHKTFGQEKKTILIGGGSGLIGSSLIPLLTTGGHRVIRLIRNKRQINENQLFWNPQKEELDLSNIEKIDAVINFSGENIGEGRWTKKKKENIIKSRTQITSFLAKKIFELKNPPDIFISSSAIGYYGNNPGKEISESGHMGEGFLAHVCNEWEKAADPVKKTDIRLVFIRIGVVLSPLGGALEKMLFPMKMGFGGKLGSGKQATSWISIEDIIKSIYYIISNKNIEGVLNLVAPHPVTNKKLVQTIGRILKRPSFFGVPEAVIKTVFGEMGREVVLSDMNVQPDNLLKYGYKFQYPDLENALRHMLGKY